MSEAFRRLSYPLYLANLASNRRQWTGKSPIEAEKTSQPSQFTE